MKADSERTRLVAVTNDWSGGQDATGRNDDTGSPYVSPQNVLPDLVVVDRARFAEGNLNARIWISLDSMTGTRLLPSVAGNIAAHLEGRLPFIFVDDVKAPRVLIVQFCVDDRSSETHVLIADFARAVLSFIGLPDQTNIAMEVASDEDTSERVPDLIRRRLLG
jgi:hypothetical protein